MKNIALKLRDSLAVLFLSLLVMTFLIFINSCGSGFKLSPFKSVEDSTLVQPGGTGGDGGGTPTVIIPGTTPGTLTPVDVSEIDDPDYVQPDPGDQQDSDDDGFPDPIDYFPDRIFYLCVISNGVSSAEVKLNSTIIFGTNSFDNTDWTECRVINPMASNNVITSSLIIHGKPGDSLALAVMEFDPDAGQFIETFFEHEITRETGSSDPFTATFSID